VGGAARRGGAVLAALIELRRVIDLAAAPDVVWRRLWDVPALARCIPGCEGVETVEAQRRYRATIRDRVGPFRIAIPLDVQVDATPPTRLSVKAAGRDSVLGSPVTVALAVTLTPAGAGGSRLAVEGQADVGGKLAALGQGVIDRKTREILDRFAGNLAGLFADGPDAAAV
jgi:carbon monoxide dehydrogenase subunit G